MKYVVKYTNPNNIFRTEPYTFETRSKKEYNDFIKRTNEYPGSYNIISDERVSEAKKK
ncbi:MAG: hypothetical protein K0Q47_36 [Sedimentibacter sp.]|jgi:hypothetical protein|nr:hypothetical protein [Sedimentibacter sp.]